LVSLSHSRYAIFAELMRWGKLWIICGHPENGIS
jgi:hypothetical protein